MSVTKIAASFSQEIQKDIFAVPVSFAVNIQAEKIQKNSSVSQKARKNLRRFDFHHAQVHCILFCTFLLTGNFFKLITADKNISEIIASTSHQPFIFIIVM